MLSEFLTKETRDYFVKCLERWFVGDVASLIFDYISLSLTDYCSTKKDSNILQFLDSVLPLDLIHIIQTYTFQSLQNAIKCNHLIYAHSLEQYVHDVPEFNFSDYDLAPENTTNTSTLYDIKTNYPTLFLLNTTSVTGLMVLTVHYKLNPKRTTLNQGLLLPNQIFKSIKLCFGDTLRNDKEIDLVLPDAFEVLLGLRNLEWRHDQKTQTCILPLPFDLFGGSQLFLGSGSNLKTIVGVRVHWADDFICKDAKLNIDTFNRIQKSFNPHNFCFLMNRYQGQFLTNSNNLTLLFHGLTRFICFWFRDEKGSVIRKEGIKDMYIMVGHQYYQQDHTFDPTSTSQFPGFYFAPINRDMSNWLLPTKLECRLFLEFYPDFLQLTNARMIQWVTHEQRGIRYDSTKKKNQVEIYVDDFLRDEQ